MDNDIDFSYDLSKLSCYEKNNLETCKLYVFKNFDNFKYCQVRDEEMIIFALSKNSDFINILKPDELSKDLLKQIIKNNPLIFEVLNKDYQEDNELRIIALKNYGYFINKIPIKEQTKELQLACVQSPQFPNCLSLIFNIHKDTIDYSLNKNPFETLKILQNRNITIEDKPMIEAVKKDFRCLTFLDKSLQREIPYEYIKKSLKTYPQLMLEIVEQPNDLIEDFCKDEIKNIRFCNHKPKHLLKKCLEEFPEIIKNPNISKELDFDTLFDFVNINEQFIDDIPKKVIIDKIKEIGNDMKQLQQDIKKLKEIK